MTNSSPASNAEDTDRGAILALCGHMVVVYGLELAFFENLRQATEGGFRVHAIVNDWENHRISPLLSALGATWSIGTYSQPFNKSAFKPTRLAKTLRGLFQTNAEVIAEVRRFKPTHVVVPDHMILVRNLPAIVYARSRGSSIIFSVANAPETKRRHALFWRFLVVPFVNHFVANSRFTAEEITRVGVSQRKLAAIIAPSASGRASTSSHLHSDRDLRRIVFVGQTIPPKGLHLLLDAIGILTAAGRDVFLDVVGPIDGWESPTYAGYRQRLLARAAQSDLADRIKFHGYVTNVPEILAKAGIHCAPSMPEQREAFGMVTLEAKQAGIPSVGFNLGAFPEMVRHKIDGWVSSSITAAGLAEGLAYFLDDERRLFAAGLEALKSAAGFEVQRRSKPWLAVYLSTLR